MRAASHEISMEAEARNILTLAVAETQPQEDTASSAQERMKTQISLLRGLWRGRGTVTEMMYELRGDD